METDLEIMLEQSLFLCKNWEPHQLKLFGEQRETNGDRPGIMLEQDPVEGRQRETKAEIMTKQDPVEGRQRETKVEIMLEQDPVEGRQRETNGDRPGIMLEQDPVEGRQRETKVEIMTKQDPVEGRQRETKGDKAGNHVGTGSSRRETKGDKWRQTWKSCWNKVCFFARIENPISWSCLGKNTYHGYCQSQRTPPKPTSLQPSAQSCASGCQLAKCPWPLASGQKPRKSTSTGLRKCPKNTAVYSSLNTLCFSGENTFRMILFFWSLVFLGKVVDPTNAPLGKKRSLLGQSPHIPVCLRKEEAL